ncbi:hypothetical protein PAXRUDRAFT_159625, partial [Paxillus rubicundulus Ve08.2h10]
TLELALVLPMDYPTSPKHTLDQDLGLQCLHVQAVMSPIFIPLQSIIRGALLVPDFKHDGDFFLVNYVDGNMFLCSKTLNT